jgi:uncharacterized protein (TIGR02453 family)
MAFKGWPKEAVTFFEGLEVDNSRDYWQANKAVYERAVRGPLEELLEELAAEFGEAKVFRPNRDIRFSKDKSPYKTNIAATIGRRGYVSFSADGLGTGSGYYVMAPDQLDRYRKAVVAERTGKQIAAITGELTRAGIELGAYETLKTAPRGYDKEHPRIELLRRKGLIAWRSWPVAAWMSTAKAKARIVDVLHAGEPMIKWLDRNVGETTDPRWVNPHGG